MNELVPKFDPKIAARADSRPAVDSNENAPPPDGVVRLPRYVVMEKQPRLTEEQVLTGKGLAKIAMDRYLTETYRALNFFTLPILGRPPEYWATFMYNEDKRLREISDYKDSVRMLSFTDRKSAEKLNHQVNRLFSRAAHDMGQ